MHWILQQNLFKESEWENLVGALETSDIPYSVHKVVPFVGDLLPPAEPKAPKVICFGSYSMRHAAKQFGWTPGVYDLFEQNFTVQLERWGKRMLNWDAQVCAFKDAVVTEPTFIRPIDDSKYFAGKVFEPAEFNEWQRNVCDLGHDYGNSLTEDTLIQLCRPRTIFAEYRIWVVGGEIITWSLYKRGDRVIYSREIDDDLLDFAAIAIMIWQPHDAFVIDVCRTPIGPKIVEINTINSAGFYAGDVQKLVHALERLNS